MPECGWLCSIRGVLLATVALVSVVACGERAVNLSQPTGAADVNATQLDVVSRLQRLEDRESVLRLQRAYGFYLSKGDWVSVASLFSEDAGFSRGRIKAFGPAEILASLQAQPRIGDGIGDGELAEEYQLQPVVHIDGDVAHGRWRTWMMSGKKGVDAYWGDGIYSADYRKDNGVWKISGLHWTENFVVPYQGGWAFNGSVNQADSDRPLWPARQTVDYRYKREDIGLVQTSRSVNNADLIRVQYLEDAAAIENLISAYGYYLSDLDFASAAALFSEDGSAELGQRGVYRGRERVRQVLELDAGVVAGNGVLNNHIDIQAVIHIAPDRSRAWSRSRSLLQLGKYDAVGLWGDAVIENEYVLEQDRWRIASHRRYPTFISEYDGGFVGGSLGLIGPSPQLPPDALPTEKYESLPGVYTPPFHYVHPVTGKPFDERPPAVAFTGWTRPPRAQAPGPLSARITRLEDIVEITNLQRSYGFIVDKALWREASELFTEQGTLEIGGRGVFVGPARIEEYYGFLGASGPVYGRLINHIQMQPLVTVDEDGLGASLHSHFYAQGGDLPDKKVAAEDARGVQTISYIGTGWYDNRYRKVDGVWRIETLHGIFRMYTFEDKGWGVFSLPNTQLEAQLPPDRPPTIRHDIYPSTFFPVEHFVNPVTGEPPRELLQ